MPSTSDYLDSLVARGIVGGDALERTMTHYGPDPVAEDIGRRTRQVGQNLWNTYTAPFQAAKQLGTAATSGTLDVTDPATAGNAFDLVAALAGGPGRPGAGELYANPTPRIVGDMVAKVNDLAARGFSKYAISKELGVGKATLDRHFAKTGLKSAAQENPHGFWESNPGAEDQLEKFVRQKLTVPQIAERLGTNEDVVQRKLKLKRDAGDFPDYEPPGPSFWHPDSAPRRDRLEQLAGEGHSLSEIARDPQLGANGDPSQISGWIKGMQDRYGKLKDWTPQSGTRNASPDPYNYSTRGGSPEDPLWEKARQIAGQSGEAPGAIYQRLKARQPQPAPDFDPSAGRDWANALRAFTGQSK